MSVRGSPVVTRGGHVCSQTHHFDKILRFDNRFVSQTLLYLYNLASPTTFGPKSIILQHHDSSTPRVTPPEPPKLRFLWKFALKNGEIDAAVTRRNGYDSSYLRVTEASTLDIS